jgi:hypothetical protein
MMRVVVRFLYESSRGPLWRASVAGVPGPTRHRTGPNPETAVGRLVLAHLDLFGIESVAVQREGGSDP